MKRTLEVIGVVIALAALIVGILNWLSPLNPVSNSPIASDGTTNQQNPTSPPIVIVVTATSEIAEVNPTLAPVTSAPVNETLANCSSLSSGETRTVLPGTYILGDVTIDGTPQYVTSIPNEGTVAYFEKEATVLAHWGAACLTGSSNLKDEIIQGELQHGCGSKCTSVRFVLVQNDGQHVELFP